MSLEDYHITQEVVEIVLWEPKGQDLEIEIIIKVAVILHLEIILGLLTKKFQIRYLWELKISHWEVKIRPARL